MKINQTKARASFARLGHTGLSQLGRRASKDASSQALLEAFDRDAEELAQSYGLDSVLIAAAKNGLEHISMTTAEECGDFMESVQDFLSDAAQGGYGSDD